MGAAVLLVGFRVGRSPAGCTMGRAGFGSGRRGGAAGASRFVTLEPGRVLRNLCREVLGKDCKVVAA